MTQVDKDFIEMMKARIIELESMKNEEAWDLAERLACEYCLEELRDITNSPEYEALKAEEDKPEAEIPDHIDKAYCMEVELDIVVGQIRDAKSLEWLKETTRRNFPKSWDREDKPTPKKQTLLDFFYEGREVCGVLERENISKISDYLEQRGL